MQMKTTNQGRKLRAISLAALLLVGPASFVSTNAAGLDTQMENMFKSMGGMASVNGPGAFKGQTMGVLSGGSVQWRVPSRNYQLFSMTAPSLKAGCGGIDLRMGSFSYINEDKFKEMLESIGDATVGLLFQAALSSLSPQLKGILDNLEAIARMVNQANVNSCKAAESLIMGASSMMGASETEQCVLGKTMKGVDMNQARAACKDNAASINKANANDPATKEIAPHDANLMWDALAKTSLTKEEKELIINIAGTVVLRVSPDDSSGPPQPKPVGEMLNSIEQLLYGSEDAPGGKIRIKPWWKCKADPGDPTKECVDMEQDASGIEVKSFLMRVQDAFDVWKGHLNANTKPALDGSDLLKMLNNTQIPVYRLMTMGYWSPDPSTMDLLIARYRKSIAYEFAYAYLGSQLRDAKGYLSNVKLQNKMEIDALAHLMSNINAQIASLDREKNNYLTQEPALNSMLSNLERMDRQFRAAGSPRIREFIGNALAMSKKSAG
jgi:conjugative transfer pilus assembly protein TraH